MALLTPQDNPNTYNVIPSAPDRKASFRGSCAWFERPMMDNDVGDALRIVDKSGGLVNYVWDGSEWVHPMMLTDGSGNVTGLLGPSGETVYIGGGAITLGTPQATTSGTTKDFAIPAGVKRITLMMRGVSISGAADVLVQLGTSGGIVSAGYVSAFDFYNSGPSTDTTTAGFGIYDGPGAGATMDAIITVCRFSGNTWVEAHSGGGSSPGICAGGGSVSLGGEATTIRLTTSNGTDTFDAGEVNVSFE